MLSWLDNSLYVGLPYALVTLSFVITYQYLRFPDVTCASTFVLGAATAAGSIVHWELNPFAAILLAALAGVAGGGLTSLFHLGLGIDKLLAGILAAFALYSVNLLVLHPSISYALHPTALSFCEGWDRRLLVDSQVPLHPASIAILIVVAIVVKLILDLFLISELGLCLRALEDETSGEAALRRLGVSPRIIKGLGLMFGNGLVAVAGALVSMQEGAANVHRGFDVLITGLIAFLIGSKFREWSFSWRRKRNPAIHKISSESSTTWALVGPLIYFGIINIAYRLRIPSEYLKILIAFSVAFAIGNKNLLADLLPSLRTLRNPWRSSASIVSQDEVESPLAQLNDVTFAYKGERTAPIVRNINLKLNRRQLILLDGHNGSGKSTLLRLLAGRLGSPDQGSIVVSGVDFTHLPSGLNAVVGFIDQDPRRELVTTLTVAENLSLANVGNRPSPIRQALSVQRIQRIREIFGKTQFPRELLDATIDEISGGQRQVINILCLFARKDEGADLTLADEPLNNLDRTHASLCLELLKDLRRLGKCVLITTHSHQGLLNFDQILRMENGTIVSEIRPDRMETSPSSPPGG